MLLAPVSPGHRAHRLLPWAFRPRARPVGGHDYLTIAADAKERKVVFVAQERDAKTLARLPNTATHKRSPSRSFR